VLKFLPQQELLAPGVDDVGRLVQDQQLLPGQLLDPPEPVGDRGVAADHVDR